jgi:hydroxypyruvate isomerase
MNRRTFTQQLAETVVGAFSLSHSSDLFSEESTSVARLGEVSAAPFKLSVTIWTVFTNLPFDQRLEKVAEAGYHNVELVGEYDKWTEEDRKRANAKRKELGIRFDCTAGLRHGVSNHEQITAGNLICPPRTGFPEYFTQPLSRPRPNSREGR